MQQPSWKWVKVGILLGTLGLCLALAPIGCNSESENEKTARLLNESVDEVRKLREQDKEIAEVHRQMEQAAAKSGKGGEESGTPTPLGPDDAFVGLQNGVKLLLSYDSTTNAFMGTVENTTEATVSRVRVEVHLSNGVELGPTTLVGLVPGQVVEITLPASSQPFTSWSAHPEVG